MPLNLPVNQEDLAGICQRYHVDRLELFGSRAKGESHPDSDVDLLVTFQEGYTPGLEFFSLAEELEKCFQHSVDLFTRASVERSPNPYKRESILSAAEPVYSAA